MGARLNRRVRTGVIRARAIDNRLTYTTHTIVRTAPDRPMEFGSLDVNLRGVAVFW
jgi:hypothetical protein